MVLEQVGKQFWRLKGDYDKDGAPISQNVTSRAMLMPIV